MKIVNVCSEANPFVKVGGLGDVSFALSKELALIGEDVSIILPLYGTMKNLSFDELKKVGNAKVYLAWRIQGFDIYQTYFAGITYYFIQNDYYFTNRPNIYGYYDDGERFAFFTLAAKVLIEKLRLKPDVVHIHDWQVGMLPVLVREESPINKDFANAKFVLTIHNPAFQGRYGRAILGDLYNLSDEIYYNGKVRFENDVSTLKAGIEYCDYITTVSPSHAKELLTWDGSWGLNNILTHKLNSFGGILNGIDYTEFDPREDKSIYQNYNLKTVIENKKKNKDAFLAERGLKPNDKPLFGVVSRLTYQKGVNLVVDAMRDLLRRGYSCFVLGSGEWEYENALNDLQREFPELMGVYVGYNDELAHKVYASADFFLMPSLFEPCGIGQMIAERYGTLPIVRMTGGLNDSVTNYDGNNIEVANGYHFFDYSSDAFLGAINWALDNFHKHREDVHNELIQNAMRTNNSWRKSAKKYLSLYQKLIFGDK